jgi:putative ATP-dependent endonuclease of the OLD family
MQLKRIRISHFRSLRDCTVEIGAHTAVLGGNGTGKSTLLRAVDRFYAPSSVVELDDFFGRDPSRPIEIELTFTDFTEAERAVFGERIHDDEMSVVRVFETGGAKGNGKYYGVTGQAPEFHAFRQGASARARAEAYEAIRALGSPFDELQAVRTDADRYAELAAWEQRHPERLQNQRDDGQFFGFTNVFRGALQRFTSFVFVPAVRDAKADSEDAKGAVIAQLMQLVVRSAVEQRQEFREWQSRIDAEYKALTDPEKLTELGSLSSELSGTLKSFYGDAAVNLAWRAADGFAIPLPAAEVSLDEDGFDGPVDRKGHGLQRAFVLTLLQHLAKATAASEANKQADATGDAQNQPDRAHDEQEAATPETPPPEVGTDPTVPPYVLPGLILAIEEPELYQHPTKQRHFARVLQQLSDGSLPGVAATTQVLFASHSSLFVSMGRFDEIHLARRQHALEFAHKECVLTSSTLDDVCRRLESAFGEAEGTHTAEGLRSRLHVIGPELAEGFFADLVVLVEGASDKAALLATASEMGLSLEALGVAILPCGGKTVLSKPAAVFQALRIPTYIIFDCDKGKGDDEKLDHNRALQRLAGVPESGLFDCQSEVSRNFASYEVDLEAVLQNELGAAYEEELDAARVRLGLQNRKQVSKSPVAMAEVMQEAAKRGARSTTLEQIVEAIVAAQASAHALPARDARIVRRLVPEEVVVEPTT